MLRDWTDSLKMDGISAEAERLFTRLLMKADDYGRFHADARLIKASCFPLVDGLRANSISNWLEELSKRGLLVLYKVDGRDFLAVINYGQRLKSSKAKFPPLENEKMDWLPTSGLFPEVPGSSRQEEKGREEEEKKKAARGSSPEMVRIGLFLKRRPETDWQENEIKAFKAISFDPEEVSIVEAFYKAPERDKEPLFRRTGMLALLNNWNGEVDKARAWAKRNGWTNRPNAPPKPPPPIQERKPIPRDELSQVFKPTTP